MLMSHGVSVAANDMLGFTPAAYARMAAHFDLERLLEVPRGSQQLPHRQSTEEAADESASGLSSFLTTRFAGQLNRQSRKSSDSLRSLQTSAETSQETRAAPEALPDSRRSSRPVSREDSIWEARGETQGSSAGEPLRSGSAELAGSSPAQSEETANGVNGERNGENGVH